MKALLKQVILHSVSLTSVASFFPGLSVPARLLPLLYAGSVFTLINQLLKPIVKLFLLPFSLVTLGLFSWIANVIILLLLTRLVREVAITGFSFPGLTQAGFVIPGFQISLPLSYIFTSFLLSLVYNLLEQLLTD